MKTNNSSPMTQCGNLTQLLGSSCSTKLFWGTGRSVAPRLIAVFASICILFLTVPLDCRAAQQSSIRIQYRELIDDSVYGHSGRPASEILEQFALSTPEGIAKRLLPRELLEKASDLEEEIDEAERAKKAVVVRQKKAELKRIEAMFEDEALLAKEVDSYVIKNKAKLESFAKLAGANTKALMSDVEPVCEPVGFVLNDALAQKDPKTLNPDLTELAAFYPRGEVEPGWADLIRTRRFVVYTDGGSYCRLFLPGGDAEQAWKSAFPVVRHILLSLLKQDAAGETLAVDVYAYENDIATTTFTMSLAKHSLRVTAKDLGTPAGMKPLDLAALRDFFLDGQTLEGCGIIPEGQLVLIGSKGKKPTLEGHPIELADLAVAYRASAYAGHGESYMSLDKAEDDDFVNVNFGGRLHDTRMGWVAYRCDLRFKTLGDDFDAVSYKLIGDTIAANMPDYASQQKRFFSDKAFREVRSEGTRFWFYPDDFKVVTAADGKSCLVTRPRFTAAAERQESFNAKGEKMDSETPPWTSLTLDHFNRNFDKFAQLFPEVAELDHAARLLAVAEWLYQKRVKGELSLDIDELLTIPLPVTPTPRNREQLRINYAVKKTGIPAEFKAYCISTAEGEAAFKKVAEEYSKPTSDWELLSVIGGGLDYSARSAVKKAVTAGEPEQLLLQKTLVSKEIFKAPDGRELRTSTAFSGKGPPMEPPSKGFVSASAPEPGPKGIGFDGTKRRFKNSKGNEVDGFVVESSGMKRLQKSDAEMFYKDGPLHSVWVGEHGTPDRFAMKTSKGVVTYRLPEQNGVMTAKLVSGRRIATEGELDFLAAALTEKDGSLPQVWNMAPVDAEIRALDMTPGREALVYYREKGGDVLRIYKGGAKPTVVKGPSALARLHEASREKVKAFSVPGKVELLHVAAEGDDVVLQIGKREPIRIKKSEWGDWLSEDGESTPPDALATVYSDLIKSDAELVVMRDALQSKPRRLMPKKTSDFEGLQAFGEGLRKAEIETFKLSPEDLLARIDELKKEEKNVSPLEGFALKMELAMLEKSKAMSPDEKAAKIAKFEAENKQQLAKATILKTQGDAVLFAGILKNKLQKLRVSYDDPSPLVPERVLREPMVKAASDVGLAIPPGEAGVDDKGILRTVAAAFDQAKIPLIKSPADLAKVGNVIVITAHNNEALFDYVQSLGEHQINGKSALDGKFLMLTTCFEEGNPNMVSELLRRYNCAGVHVQSERVNKDAVKRALVEFGKALRDLKPDAPAERLRDIFDESVRRVLRSDDPGVESLKTELEKLLRARVQWCALPPSRPKSQGIETTSLKFQLS